MKNIILSFLFILPLSVFGQGVFIFDTLEYDFGVVPKGKQVKYAFHFKNQGNQPIVISNVEASCGCTTPNWSKKPIPPQESGFVEVVFDSNDTKGMFVKTIHISSNAYIPQQYLKIKGTVVSKTDSPYMTEKQTIINDTAFLQTKNTILDFGNLSIKESKTYQLHVLNAGKETLKINSLYSRCQCIKYKSSFDKLESGETGTIDITYTPEKISYTPEYIKIDSNHKYGIKMLKIKADISE